MSDPIGSPQVLSVLQRLNTLANGKAHPADFSGDCILLKSEGLPDLSLLQRIENKWPEIVGPEKLNSRPFHCEVRPNEGVWLHYLETASDRAEYAPGIHRIPQW